MAKRSTPDDSSEFPVESSPAKRSKKSDMPVADNESALHPRRVKRSTHAKPAVVYLFCCNEEGSTKNMIAEFGTEAEAVAFLTWISRTYTDSGCSHQHLITILRHALPSPKSDKLFSFSDKDAVSQVIESIQEEAGGFQSEVARETHNVTHMHKTWDAVIYYDQQAHSNQDGSNVWEITRPMGIFSSENFAGVFLHKISSWN